MAKKTKYHINCMILCIKCTRKMFTFSNWLDCVQGTLNNCGISEYWIHQNIPKIYCLSKMVKNRLIDQSWYNSVFDLSNLLNFRTGAERST